MECRQTATMDKPKWMCNHPELFPTAWADSRPEPAEIIYSCECGENWACPVCGWGAGTYPCSCTRGRHKGQDLRVWYDEISERYVGAWEVLAKL